MYDLLCNISYFFIIAILFFWYKPPIYVSTPVRSFTLPYFHLLPPSVLPPSSAHTPSLLLLFPPPPLYLLFSPPISLSPHL